MKVFWIMLLLTTLNIGIVVLMDLIQSIPLDDIVGVLKLPLGLLGGEEKVLLFLSAILLIIIHRRIMKSEKSTQKTG